MDFKSLKESLDQSHIYDASEMLVKLYIKDPKHFKRSLLLSNSLPEPIGKQISKDKFESLTKAFVLAGDKLINKNEDISIFVESFYQISNTIRVINQNITSNLKRLEHNSFLKYPLSQQLQMVCIYIEDQSRLFNEQNKSQNGFLTGMENQVARYEADDAKGIKVSQTDNLEALIEISDTLLRYLYFKSEESELEESFFHEDISPYGISSLQEIMQLALQRNILVETWGKFKFREWTFKKVKKNASVLNLFEPSSKQDYLKERIAIDRYIYRDHINMQQINVKYKKRKSKV